MRVSAWLSPPRQILTIFLSVAVVSAVALGGLAWKLLEQDRDLETQRRQVQLEQRADALVAAMQQALGDLQAQVGAEPAHAASLPPDVVAISIVANRVSLSPARPLLYHPAPASGHEFSPPAFSEGERLEFTAGDTAGAVETYTRLLATRDPAVRGGALLRLARVHRRRGAYEQALHAYTEIAELDPLVVEGWPSALIARLGRIRVFEKAGRTTARGEEAARLLEDLRGGRWPLTKAQYESHSSEARRFLASPPPDDAAAITRAGAATWLWERRGVDSPLTRSTIALPTGFALVVWKSTAARLDGLIAGPAYLSSLSSLGQSASDPSDSWSISDLEGRPILGGVRSAGPPVVRTALTSGLPWTLHVFAPDSHSLPPSPRRSLLFLVLSLVAIVLSAGWYFVFRSLSRERHVAALQSDFVAAVSHEFRSPLTALSHAADLLAHDRLPSDALRRQAYDVLVRDTSRLRSLVEGLLEFGRLEAGATAFRFEEVEVTELVRSTVAEFQDRVSADGYTIGLSSDRDVHAAVDRDALSRALWNLLDNAVKYSPESRAVDVELTHGGERVSISVRDHGMGIPASEQRTIFDRFVRGAESKSRRIRGTGIGLAIVRQIIRAHGGDVLVESEVGAGSTFTLVLPELVRNAGPSTSHVVASAKTRAASDPS